MNERKKVAPKTYISRYKDQSFTFTPEGQVGSDTIIFVAGEYTTDLEDEQKHLESRDQFKHGIISLKPSDRAALEAKAVSLRASAVKASGEAKAAEEALVAFDKAAAPAVVPGA
jgi:hypothetical protein